jgi:hypothetical protein
MTYHRLCCRISPALRRHRPYILYWSKIRCCFRPAYDDFYLTWETTP